MGFKVKTFDYGALHFLFREIFVENEYFFLSGKKRPLIIDGGSNIGLATLYFKWLYPQSQIYCFEPDPETFKILLINIKQNHLKDISAYNVALWEKKGRIDFFVDLLNPGWLTMSAFYNRLPKNKIKVKSVCLSQYLKKKKIDFLKLDIEGAENNVIEELLRNNVLGSIDQMQIEYHYDIESDSGGLSLLIQSLLKAGFKFSFGSHLPISMKKDITFQDITIFASKHI